jgi:hypothetical protein
MLENQPMNTPFPVTLLGMEAAGVMPQNDCTPEDRISSKPQWQAQAGEKFEAAIYALPQRILNEVTLTAGAWQNQQGQSIGLRPDLCAMEYELLNRNWVSREVPANSQSLANGLQIYKLSANIPENLPPGIYHGKVTISAPMINLTGQLAYQVKIKP